METNRDLLGVNVYMKDTQQDAKSPNIIPPHEVTHLVIISILPALHTAYSGFAVAVDCISRIRYRYICRHTFHHLSLLPTD